MAPSTPLRFLALACFALLAGCPVGLPQAEICGDGIDNDSNLLTDCDDAACAADPACASLGESDCDDGEDDDGDGLIDCEDEDCAEDCDPEICDNGLDDDRDGDIDCVDLDCVGDPACGGGPEDCSNGVDDDGDGWVDCEDLDCSADPACDAPPAENCTNGIDDDLDGLLDCDDPDCYDHPGCEPPEGEVCDNGVDDDGDGFVDCDDLDCVDEPGCEPVFEDCTNGIDDDADGYTDCEDFECLGHPACVASENCLNELDDDGDGLIDCADPDCAGDPVCAPPEVCDNGLDDDRDGLADCADPDCAFDPACSAPSPELCANGVDDDGDGFVDCDDIDCSGDPLCAPATEECANGLDDDRDGLADCLDPDCFSDPACGATEDCDNGIDDDGDFFIDCADSDCASFPGCAGSPERCANGVDDDLDGLVDCDDFDCAFDPACAAPEVCTGGFDEDGDGLIDCDDPDCAFDPACTAPPVEDCTNGFDDDFNGLVDCDDPACAGHPDCAAPGREICNNRLDDDFDGLLDCDDPDCAADPGCAPPPVENCVNGTDDDLDGFVDCDDSDCSTHPFCAPPSEICTNGFDDDFDGLLDCDDSDCAADPACAAPVPEDCTNGVDDDGDGLVDCDDPGCAFDPACAAGGVEDCDNGIDDDGDFFIDCTDPDCDSDPACAGGCPADAFEPNDSGPGAAAISIASGETVEESGLHLGSEEDWYRVEVPAGCTLDASVLFSDFLGDMDLQLLDSAGSVLTGASSTTDDEFLSWTNDQAASQFVDLRVYFWSGDCNEYTLSLTLECGSGIENCGNGLDDDFDGAIDCDDPDCAGDPICDPGGPEVCDNGLDDDLDGLADCDDSDCAADPACAPGCASDSLEPNDDAFGATPLALAGDGDVVDLGGLTLAEDEDWFSAALPTGCTVSATASFTHADGDIDLALLDSGGTVLTSSASTSDNESIEFDNTGAAQDVFLRVYFWDGTCSNYALSVIYDCESEPEPENCTNGIDDDGDGFIDCDDSECASLPACLSEECGNGIDDDLDGLVDCDDGDCTGTPGCTPEDCDNGVDDNANGLVDCDDSECALDPACTGCPGDGLEPNDLLSAATPLALVVDGDSVDLSGLTLGDDEDWFSVSVPAGCTLDSSIFFSHAAGDIDLQLRDTSSTVLTSSASTTDNEAISWENTGGGPASVFLRVHFWDGSCSTYDFSASLSCGPAPVEDCDNGIDDDFDGFVDCADSDCAADPACIPDEDCDNGVDDDLDGFTDCADADCASDPACIPDEDCDNGIDDDLDGLTDCDDSDCVSDPGCDSCPEDGFEPNDVLATASSLGLFGAGDSVSLSGLVLGDNEDWFSATVPAGCTLESTVFFSHALGDMDLELRNSSSTVLTSSASVTDNETISWENTGGSAAPVYLRVSFWDGTCSSYDLAAAISCGPPPVEDCDNGFDDDLDGFVDCADADCASDPACIPDEDCDNGIDDDLDGFIDCDDADCAADPACDTGCPADGFEPNDSISDPTGLLLFGDGDTDNVPGLTLGEDDDWYATTLAAGCTLNVNVLFSDALGDIDIELVDSAGTQLALSETNTDNESLSYTNSTGSAQPVFLRVYYWDATTCGSYDLETSLSCPPDACIEDVFEPNDNAATATGLLLFGDGDTDAIVGLTLGENEDWFVANVPAGCSVDLNVLFTDADGDIDLDLYDSSLTSLDTSTTTTDNENVSWSNSTGSTVSVFLRVYFWSGTCTSYDFSGSMSCP